MKSLFRLLISATVWLGLGSAATAQNIDVDPLSWDFGTVVLGDTATRTFTITSLSPYFDSEVGTIAMLYDATGAFSTNAPPGHFYVPLGGTFDFDVFFTPTALGPATATLFIPSSDLRHPDLPIPLRGTAVTRAAVPTPATCLLVLLGAAFVPMARRTNRDHG